MNKFPQNNFRKTSITPCWKKEKKNSVPEPVASFTIYFCLYFFLYISSHKSFLALSLYSLLTEMH